MLVLCCCFCKYNNINDIWIAKCHKSEGLLSAGKETRCSFYQKKTEKSDRLNVFIITFATLIKNNGRNRDYDEVLSTYSHIHVYHDPLGLMDSICVST